VSSSSSQSSNHPPFQSSSLPLFDEPFLRKLERLALLSRRAMAGQMQGERLSPKRGQSVEFADFRPYSRGDDFRRIDWNAYARLERFYIKLFVEEEDLTVHVLLDASRSMDWGEPNKLWYAVRAAGALGYVVLSGLDRVTVTALGSEQQGGGSFFPPARGKRQAMPLFAFLQAFTRPVTVGAGRAPAFQSSALPRYAASHSPGPLILVSDLLEDGWQEGLGALAARGFEVTVLHVLSPDEIDPERAAWLGEGASRDVKLLDVESGAGVEITADYETIQRYRQGVNAWRDELGRFCSARGIQYVPVETSVPFEELLFALLRQRGVLR
jgi:uncharacterized protein (DUF58 family)